MSGKSALRLGNKFRDQSSLEWNGLNGKLIKNSTVILQGFGDIHPYHPGPKFNAEKVYVYNCDKNFVFYWINEWRFPNLKELNLMSHPCEPCVLRQNFPLINLSQDYLRYKRRWAEFHDNVVVKDTEEMRKDMDSHKNEDILCESIDEKKEEDKPV